jgi:hypothetical protein
MYTPFDAHAARATENGYHNHRDNSHSDIISDGIVEDLKNKSALIKAHLEAGVIGYWKNQPNPWGRERDTDLVLAEPLHSEAKKSKPDMKKIRLVVEHKSVLTAHRNRDARYDDLNNLCSGAGLTPNIIVAATVMIGIAERYLNVADQIKNRYMVYKETPSGRQKKVLNTEAFNNEIMKRIFARDETLFVTHEYAVSLNTRSDIESTFAKFRQLPVRDIDNRKKAALDALLLVPVFYDNVHASKIVRNNPFNIDVDKEYDAFILKLARIYENEYGDKS